MGAYPKYQKRTETEGYALQDTAVGERRNPYLGCFCGDKSMGRGSRQTNYYLHRRTAARHRTRDNRYENSYAGQECV